MVAMIEALIARGHAYAAEGHVLFDVRSYPDYGQLSGRSVNDMIAGARVEVAPYKRDPMDFVLWKPSDDSLPGWDSPWGRGRPGWHIECSAMSLALLGESFDIHGGGLDLQFPHHENELAQSMCAHPKAEFARYWLHNEMLQVEGKKMSKSLGNFFTVRDLLDKGVPGEVIRFVYLQTHYSKPMDWTEEKVRAAEATLRKWAVFARGVPASLPDRSVVNALADDINTHAAISELHRIYLERDAGALRASANLLGLMVDVHERWLDSPGFENIREEIMAMVLPLLDELNAAREGKDYVRADAIRDALRQIGVQPSMVSGEFVWRFNWRGPAEARDRELPEFGFLGASEYIAGSLREDLTTLRKRFLK